MLHTKATCFAALRPLPYIPATEKGGKKEVKKKKKEGISFSEDSSNTTSTEL